MRQQDHFLKLFLLKQLQKDLDVSIMIITHNFGIVSELCDDVSVMYAGTVLETGKKQDLFRNAVNPYSKALIESIPKSGHAGEKLTTIPGTPPELFDIVPGCPFAPRCSLCSEICLKDKPLLRPCAQNLGVGHMAACHNRKEAFHESAVL